MKTSLFEHECTKVSRTLGRKHDLRVVFRGQDAKTDGNTVVLPALDQMKDLSAEQVKVGRGYVDHETAHVIYTDMPAYQEAATSRANAGDKLYPMVLNALEDVRIERCMRRDYPGVLTNLTSTCEAVNLEYLKRYKKEPQIAQDPRVVGAIALTWEGRKRDGYPTTTNDQCLDTLDPSVRDRIAKWIDAVASCNSTADVIALADLCSQDLRKAAVEEKEQPSAEAPEEKGKKGKGQSGAKGKGKGKGEKSDQAQEPCKGGGEGEDEPEAKPEQGEGEGKAEQGEGKGKEKGEDEPDEGEGKGKPEAGDDGEGLFDDLDGDDIEQDGYEAKEEEAGEGKITQGGEGGGGAGSSVLGDEVEQAELPDPEPLAVWVEIEKVLGTKKGNRNARDRYVAFDTSFDQVHTRNTDIALNDPANDARYETVRQSVSGVLSVMKRKVERALIAIEQRGWQGGQEWGRLDNRRLVGAYRGDADVFRLKDNRREINTAVQILIDLSGSMHGGCPQKIVLAQQAAICLAEAIARNGVALEVTGFHCMGIAFDTDKDPGSYDRWTLAMHGQAHTPTGTVYADKQKFSRWSQLDCVVFKDFEDDMRVARRSLAAIEGQCGGDNCDGESVMWAYQRLAKRPEPRKIMLVLSDGKPATNTSFDEEHLGQHLRDVTGYIESQPNTTILGVGIASAEVRKYYSRHVVVRSITELGGTVMDQLAKLMLGERFHASNKDLYKANKL